MVARLRATLYSLGLIIGLSGCEKNGPTIKDPSYFLGCYQLGKEQIEISARAITIKGRQQRTEIKRFFVLKDRNAVNVVNDIEIDADIGRLSVGSSETGFFYNFDDSRDKKAILIPDNNGNINRLIKVNCS